jgi:hypothetical protein
MVKLFTCAGPNCVLIFIVFGIGEMDIKDSKQYKKKDTKMLKNFVFACN